MSLKTMSADTLYSLSLYDEKQDSRFIWKVKKTPFVPKGFVVTVRYYRHIVCYVSAQETFFPPS